MTNVTDVMRNRGETTIEYNLCSRERVFAPLSLSSPLESQSNSRASPSASALGSRRRATYRVYHQLYPTRFVLPCGSLFLFLLVDVPVSHSPRSRKKNTSHLATRTADRAAARAPAHTRHRRATLPAVGTLYSCCCFSPLPAGSRVTVRPRVKLTLEAKR